MFCPNRIHDKTVSDLRANFVQCQKYLLHYKKLYTAECKKYKSLQKQNCKLRKDIDLLRHEMQLRRHDVPRNQTDTCTSKYRKRKLKNWEDITSERTKRRHYSHYKDIIFQALCNIGVCHRAEITLWFPNNNIHFSWSPDNFQPKPNTCSDLEDTHIYHDHPYTASLSFCENENIEYFNDLNYSEIFDVHGDWSRKHIRWLIHVLDTFRISHEAYHELQMVSKGHLPPMNRLSNEKKTCLWRYHT